MQMFLDEMYTPNLSHFIVWLLSTLLCISILWAWEKNLHLYHFSDIWPVYIVLLFCLDDEKVVVNDCWMYDFCAVNDIVDYCRHYRMKLVFYFSSVTNYRLLAIDLSSHL